MERLRESRLLTTSVLRNAKTFLVLEYINEFIEEKGNIHVKVVSIGFDRRMALFLTSVSIFHQARPIQSSRRGKAIIYMADTHCTVRPATAQ